MGHGEIVERLRRHYKENVLEPEPNPKCEELKERLKGPDGKKLLAEGLSKFKSPYTTSPAKLQEAEVDEFGIFELTGPDFQKSWGFKAPPFIGIKIPKDKYRIIGKKWGVGESSCGTVLDKKRFEKDSPFYGTNVALFIDDYAGTICEHEALHILHREASVATKRIVDAMSDTDTESLKSFEEKMKYCELVSLENVTELLSELFAYRSDPGLRKGDVSYDDLSHVLKYYYVEKLSERFADELTDVLPNGGLVSKHAIRAIAKTGRSGYLKSEVDKGTMGLKILENDLAACEVTRMMLGIGPTPEEIQSGRYVSPIDELVEWSKHYEEALDVDFAEKPR